MSALGSTLPDPGSPEFPAVVAVLMAFVGEAVARLHGGDWEQAERAAFRWGFFGTALGLAVYLAAVIAGLY